METQLTILERRIDELLASVDLPRESEPIPKEEEAETAAGSGAAAEEEKGLDVSGEKEEIPR